MIFCITLDLNIRPVTISKHNDFILTPNHTHRCTETQTEREHSLVQCRGKLLVLRRSHHGNEASDEAEVGEVVGVDGRSRVNLQTVVVFTGVLKQTVHGVQHLMRQQEKPLPTDRNTERQ